MKNKKVLETTPAKRKKVLETTPDKQKAPTIFKSSPRRRVYSRTYHSTETMMKAVSGGILDEKAKDVCKVAARDAVKNYLASL